MNISAQIDMSMPIRMIKSPQPPRTLDDLGLDQGFLIELLCKTLYRMGMERPSEVSTAMRIPVNLVEQLLELAKQQRLVETLGQRNANMTSEMRYALTSKGREWALDGLAQSEWIGVVPVPLEQFAEQAESQSIRQEGLDEPMLREVFQHLTLRQSLMDEIGPAVNSFSAILLYGPPGNGKSSIAAAICEAYQDHIYLPHALVVEKQIITLYDPTVHQALDGDRAGGGSLRLRREAEYDERYVCCRRPQVTTGGELTLDMMDLSYNPATRVYEAPLQLKATGGVFVVDDFGRQRQEPQALINRLIVPLEAGVDYLALRSGRKFEISFDTLVIFSTNIAPRELVDDAALRRLRYKIEVSQPDEITFLQIFANAARSAGLELSEETLTFILFELYGKRAEAEYHAFHPKFFCDQTIAMCSYKKTPKQFTEESLRHAWRNLFSGP